MTRARLNIFIEPEQATRLAEVAAVRGVSKSSLIAAALSRFLAPQADQQGEAIVRRLDRLSRQLGLLQRDQTILTETMVLFIRHSLALALPVPQSQQEAVRAQGRLRYAQFFDQLVRHLQRGRSLAREVEDGIGAVDARDVPRSASPDGPDSVVADPLQGRRP